MTPARAALALFILSLLSGCASLGTDHASNTRPLPSMIGPYHRITARILVVEPEHIWQAMMDWQSVQAGEGKIRIVHALSGLVVELRWQHDKMWLRDNQTGNARWHLIARKKLVSYGIIISPRELSGFLGGHVPSGFQLEGPNRWTAHRDGNRIRVEWNAQNKHLTFGDLSHGRKMTIIILKSGPPAMPRAQG